MRFITKHQDITYVLRQAQRVREGGFTQTTKGIRAHFKGIGQGEFDTDVAARRFNWSDEDKRFAEEALLRHFDFNAPYGGFKLEPGQDLPDWALELAGAEAAIDVTQMAGGSCQFVYTTDSEATGCPQLAISSEVPYCLKHAMEAGYEVSVSKPEPKPEPEPEPAKTGRTQPRRKVAAG